VKSANPNAFVLAEYYENPGEYLTGNQWDSVMNYTAFADPVSGLFTGMEKHSQNAFSEQKGDVKSFDELMGQKMAEFPYDALYSAMNELDNHDVSRFLTRTNGQTGDAERSGSQAADEKDSIDVLRQAAMFQFTWPGDPTIYYGDEAGVAGWTDPDDRRTYPWGHENKGLVSYYAALGKLHKDISSLATGSFKTLLVTPEQKVYSYGRWNTENKVATAYNFDEVPRVVQIPVWQLGAQDGDNWKTALRSGDDTSYSGDTLTVVKGEITVNLPAHTGVLLTSTEGVKQQKL
jgi:alpha-glucosidase